MEGSVPDIYKILTVNPAPKVPRLKVVEEFRSINTFSTLEKLLETIVKLQLVIEDNELLAVWLP